MPKITDKFDIENAEFKLFLVLWNQTQNRTTPELHFKMADWLEWNWTRKNTRLLLQAFRSSGKSTIVGIFCAWLLYRWPDLRILVLAADYTLAKKMVRNVKRILERHPLTPNARPKTPDEWAGDRFTVRRMLELRDPSMLARGITSNITGSRADIVICDDVEVPNTCETAEKREALRERLAEMEYVLAGGQGTQLYVGTPHTYFSIYADNPRTESGEETIFLPDFERLSLPIYNEKGQSIWPERYPNEALTRMKRQTGPNKFASQMLLQPRNIAEGRLNPDLLQIYDDTLDYTKEIQTLFLGKTKLITASAWWDPAFGSASGDKSVLAIIYQDEAGMLYLHHMAYITASAADESDEATQQCMTIAKIAKDHHLPSLSVETNGIGKFLPSILRNELARAKAPCRVKEMTSTRSKDLRILEAFDAVLAARRLYVHKSVFQTPFMTEMREWRPGRTKGHDDGLDAAAGALSQLPARIDRIMGQGAQNWMRTGKPSRAKTKFDL